MTTLELSTALAAFFIWFTFSLKRRHEFIRIAAAAITGFAGIEWLPVHAGIGWTLLAVAGYFMFRLIYQVFVKDEEEF